MPIKFSLSSSDPLSVAADVLVLGVPEGSTLKDGTLGELGKALGPSLGKAVKREDFTGKKDQTLDLAAGGTDLKPGRVLLVGLGDPAKLTEADVRVFAAKGARFALGPRPRRWRSRCSPSGERAARRARPARLACPPRSGPRPRGWCSAPTASPST